MSNTNQLRNISTNTDMKYKLWRSQSVVAQAYSSLPKCIIKYNTDMRNNDLTIAQVRQYIAEITRQ